MSSKIVAAFRCDPEKKLFFPKQGSSSHHDNGQPFWGRLGLTLTGKVFLQGVSNSMEYILGTVYKPRRQKSGHF